MKKPLPKHADLQRNGWYELSRAIGKSPKAFETFEMDQTLPHGSLMRRNGWSGLAAIIKIHSDRFAGFEQLMIPKTDAEHIRQIKELTAGGNPIPHRAWLTKNGFSSLVYFLSKHPGIVEKHGQIRKTKLDSEHIDTILKLTNFGESKIPTCKWLLENGHSDLYAWLNSHPKIVKQYGQERARTDERQLTLLRSLLTPEGKIPHGHWLRRNGYMGLQSWLRKHPEVLARYGQINGRQYSGRRKAA